MENLATILVGALVLVVVSLLIASISRDKKQGKSSCGSCGSGCAGCSMSGSCHGGSKT